VPGGPLTGHAAGESTLLGRHAGLTQEVEQKGRAEPGAVGL